MISNLKDILLPASNQGYAVACFNVFGFEDSKAVVDAAEARNASVILSINLDMRQFMSMEQIIGMLRPMAESSKAPVCIRFWFLPIQARLMVRERAIQQDSCSALALYSMTAITMD